MGNISTRDTPRVRRIAVKQEALKVFTKEILDSGAHIYGVKLESLEKLAGFENLIYAGVTFRGEEVILRYSHSSHRVKDQIEAELHWLSYLSQRRAAVCEPLPSIHGNLVEEVPLDGGFFFISCFQKAHGRAMNAKDRCWDATFFYRWGQATGELHRLSKDYIVPEGLVPRKDYLSMGSDVFFRFLPENSKASEVMRKVIREVSSLPKTKDSYGLCHTDLHNGNFFYDQQRLWIFDFDDCAYHYLIHDLAISLYYVIWRYLGSAQELTAYATEFFRPYLAGYLKEHYLPLAEIERIPLFLRLRDCDLYGLLHHEWISNLTEQRKTLLTQMGERIMKEEPIVLLPYAKLYEMAQR